MDFFNFAFDKTLSSASSIGIVLIVLIFLLRRQEDKIDELSKMIEERDNKIDNKIAEIEHQLKEFITKEEHYRDVSGWREGLQKLEAKLDRFIERFLDTKRD
jgi:uncharacterized coiled-coil protein SlyX